MEKTNVKGKLVVSSKDRGDVELHVDLNLDSDNPVLKLIEEVLVSKHEIHKKESKSEEEIAKIRSSLIKTLNFMNENTHLKSIYLTGTSYNDRLNYMLNILRALYVYRLFRIGEDIVGMRSIDYTKSTIGDLSTTFEGILNYPENSDVPRYYNFFIKGEFAIYIYEKYYIDVDVYRKGKKIVLCMPLDDEVESVLIKELIELSEFLAHEKTSKENILKKEKIDSLINGIVHAKESNYNLDFFYKNLDIRI